MVECRQSYETIRGVVIFLQSHVRRYQEERRFNSKKMTILHIQTRCRYIAGTLGIFLNICQFLYVSVMSRQLLTSPNSQPVFIHHFSIMSLQPLRQPLLSQFFFHHFSVKSLQPFRQHVLSQFFFHLCSGRSWQPLISPYARF